MFDSSLWGLVANNASIDPNSSPFFFLNTVSNVRVNLPSALTIPQQVNSDNIPFDKMVASSSPSSKDCFIAGRFEDFQHIAFCMLGDKSWTIIKSENANTVVLDIEILNKKLYVLACQARERFIEAYDLQNLNTTRVEVLPFPAYHGVMSDNRRMGNISHASNASVYFLGKNLVSGELLLIRGLYDGSYDNNNRRIIGQSTYVQKFIHLPFTREFRLWKYKYSDSEWIEIDNLGDCSIFLGDKSFTVISVNHLTHQELVERNYISFAHWKDSSGSDSLPFKLEVGIFSLINKRKKY
ncbi:hypothetical protein L6164_028851 [Bauhinia variegata]|uniref:Uncharacterized protein n=1 Tax=Bauhinia variegata TaxID=167791 RepID=A0ACB9L8S9_BAUVA|nr:hypothetical protein L6164_028851 [Bauhinia variegata]